MVLWYELQTTNTSILELFLDDFHDDFKVLWIIEVVGRELVQKVAKRNKSGQNFGGCTGTCTDVYQYTPPEANMYRYMPTECNMYRYMSRVYRYM